MWGCFRCSSFDAATACFLGFLQAPTSHSRNLQGREQWHPTIGNLFHGDEGRGVRKGNTVVCSMETPIGLDSYTSDCYSGEPCCRQHGDRVRPVDFQNVNLRFHSFLTKFLLFLLPGKVYKDNNGSNIMDGLLRVVFQDLRALYYEGVQIGSRVWNLACIGCKGDLQWFLKLGGLQRSFARLSHKSEQECCHECLAGGPQYPWEDLSENPAWAATSYKVIPWTEEPSSGMLLVPYDRSKPEAILKRDVFHIAKVGVLQDFVASAMLLVLELGYFPGESNARSSQLERLHSHFNLFCSAKGRSPALHSFTKQFLNCPTRKHYAWCKSKGSDTVLLVQWVVVLAAACLNAMRDPQHAKILRAIRAAAQSADAWLKKLYSHGLWWKPSCGRAVLQLGNRFLKAYNYLAFEALQMQFPAFAMKPKIHLLAHVLQDLRTALSQGSSRILSCNVNNCEMNEDFIGRICRLARKCHQKRVMERVLNMYLVKAHLLHKRYVKSRDRKRKFTEALASQDL